MPLSYIFSAGSTDSLGVTALGVISKAKVASAGMDAIGEAGKLGIRAENAARYINDGAGTVTNFECVSLAVGEVRCGRKVSKAWKEGIETYEK